MCFVHFIRGILCFLIVVANFLYLFYFWGSFAMAVWTRLGLFFPCTISTISDLDFFSLHHFYNLELKYCHRAELDNQNSLGTYRQCVYYSRTRTRGHGRPHCCMCSNRACASAFMTANQAWLLALFSIVWPL